MISGIKRSNVEIITTKLVIKVVPTNKEEIINTATARATPSP